MPDRPTSVTRLLRRVLAIASGCGVTAVAVAAGLGWLYLTDTWLGPGPGPRAGDALPLLQLASRDAQSLVSLAVIWGITGIAVGLLLRREFRSVRVAIVGGTAVVLLVLDSQVSYAVSRNDAFSTVLTSHMPGGGVFTALVAIVAGSLIAGSPSRHSITTV